MAKKIYKTSDAKLDEEMSRPALTPEARENQLIALAYDLVEKRIRNGTATSQEVCHFLKLGSTRERLEQEKLVKDQELIEAKKESLKSAKATEEMYQNALAAMREYTGSPDSEEADNNGQSDF